MFVRRFSGKEDRLSRAVEDEVKRRGVKLKTVSVDKDDRYGQGGDLATGICRWLPFRFPLQRLLEAEVPKDARASEVEGSPVRVPLTIPRPERGVRLGDGPRVEVGGDGQGDAQEGEGDGCPGASSPPRTRLRHTYRRPHLRAA